MLRRFPHLSLCLGLALALLMVHQAGSNPPEPNTAKLNKKVDPFKLPLPSGKEWSSDEVKDARAVVVVFLSFECPVSNGYAPTLVGLHEKFKAEKVAFLGVIPGDDLSLDEMGKYVRQYNLPFPVVRDGRFQLADQLHATTVPEAFVLDGNRVLRYRGRIDDSYTARLKRNPKASSRDLEQAVKSVLAGESVRTPATHPIGCAIARDRVAKNDGKVTYHRDVLPILQEHCQGCHRPGEVGPFSLLTYKQAVNWAEDIRDYTREGKMPPWKASGGGPFHHERKMSEKELAVLDSWVKEGTPEGDPAHAPRAREFTDGWQLGTPDLVLTLPEEMVLGASGKDLFRCFVLPTGLTEDKFVTAVEVRPGNKRIVHHTLNFFDTSGKAREMEQKERQRPKKANEVDRGPGYTVGMGVGFTPKAGQFGGIGGWAPGQRSRFLPEGYGWPLPRGADVVLQLHYHRNGRVESDRTSVGLYFAKNQGTKPYRSAVIPGRFLVIPPGVENHKVTGQIEALEDGELRSVMHHMHMLGRSAKVTMTPPGGQPTTLLEIKDWDYNWQETYFFQQPVPFKAGTKFSVEANYDNTDRNPNNPFNPPTWVRFGEQTDNEMCFVFLGVTTASGTPGPLRVKSFGIRPAMAR